MFALILVLLACATGILAKIFKDGSKIEDKLGASLSIWDGLAETKACKLKLSSYCTVYQAELLAICRATKYALEGKQTSWAIISDSRSVLETVTITSSLQPLAIETRNNIMKDAKKMMCDLNDMKCTTAAQQKLAYWETRGKKGLWDSSDPLKRSVIESSAPFLSIKAINSELTGMLQCHAEFLKMNTEAQTMDYSFICPRLTEAGDYKVNGYIGDEYVNGTGACRVTRDQHRMLIKTKYEKYIQNEKQHIEITGYEIVPGSGKVSYDCETKLFNDDKQKADRVLGYMNKNWITMEKNIGHQMLLSFLKKYIKNINDELRVIAITDFFFYEV